MKFKIAIFIVFLFLTCGCDNKKCIKSHQEKKDCVIYSYIYSGKVMIPIPHYYECEVNVCDEWSDK